MNRRRPHRLDIMVRNGEFERLLKYPTPFVLGHDVAGGLGSTVIQLAKHLGATVATTVSANNAEFVRSLGADIVVDYIKTFPFVKTFEALAYIEHGHANGKTIIALD